MKNCSYPVQYLVLSLAISAGAHSGERLYPIPELTDEMLERVQLDDGSVEEWYDLVGEPAMSLVDFRAGGNRIPDPSDLDFRIWISWHDDPARLYVAYTGSDDVYITDDRGDDGELLLSVDGDHSGGQGYSNLSFNEAENTWGEAQQYGAVARMPGIGPALYGYFTASSRSGGGFSYVTDISLESWLVHPPYGDAGGDVAGENPTISVVELYITPFDRWLGFDSRPEDIVVSDLTAGDIVGFALVVRESDNRSSRFSLTPEAVQTRDPESDLLFHHRADYYLDGLLLPADRTDSQDGSAVESVTWGRIKAALDME